MNKNPYNLRISEIKDFSVLTPDQQAFAQELLDTYGLAVAERYAQVVICAGEPTKEVAHLKGQHPSVAKAAERDRVVRQLSDRKVFALLSQVRRHHWVKCNGQYYLSTEQVGQFYRVRLETIKSALVRERQNLEVDGLTTLCRSALQEFRNEFGINPFTPSLIVWPPRAVLRAGLILQTSEVAAKLQELLAPALQSAKRSVKLEKKKAPLRVLLGARA